MLNLMRRRPLRGIAGNSKKSEDNSFWPLIASPLLEGSILLLTHTYNQTILRKTITFDRDCESSRKVPPA